MMGDAPLETLAKRLEAFLSAETGTPAKLAEFRPMADGHAGHTFAFELCSNSACRGFVLKIAPVGVPRRGSADIYRQAPLLRSLSSAGYPAPAAVWASNEDEPLGAPFIIMERLAGRSFIIWEPAPEFIELGPAVKDLWLETAKVMAHLHQLNWRAMLEDWAAPTTLGEELDRWEALLRHMPDDGWLALARRLGEQLRKRTPPDAPVGLIHGDFQPGNVLFDEGRTTGVIDWDLAAVGPQGTDVGWLLMMADPRGWAHDWAPFGPPAADELLEAYWSAGGQIRSGLRWHQAFAHFRLAAIAGLNLKLHRQGRRPDAIWERFATSIPPLLHHGLALA